MLYPRQAVQHGPRWTKERRHGSPKLNYTINRSATFKGTNMFIHSLQPNCDAQDIATYWQVNPKGHTSQQDTWFTQAKNYKNVYKAHIIYGKECTFEFPPSPNLIKLCYLLAVNPKGRKAQQMVLNENFKILNTNVFGRYSWENMTCFSSLWMTNDPKLPGAIQNSIVGILMQSFGS